MEFTDTSGRTVCALPVASETSLPAAPSGTPPAATPPAPLSQTFQLHSRPSASKRIYLDFDGHTTTGTQWNSTYTSGAAFSTPAFDFDGNVGSFSDAEKERIQLIWLRVVEDFAPFDVDITTQDPGVADLENTGSGDTRWGTRVVIGGSSGGSGDWYTSSVGGVAYIDSFGRSLYSPCFVFEENLGNGDEKDTAEAISHEVGHTLGLSHDGRTTPPEDYYWGHGTGPTGWAPIMGVGYDRELVQWSKGEYTAANNTQDDLSIITTRPSNGFGYRPDDHSNGISTATALSINGANLSGSGVIEQNTDIDVFQFTLSSATTVTLNVTPTGHGPNLDVMATLLDGTGTAITTSNPAGSLAATLSTSLAAGTYYLTVDG